MNEKLNLLYIAGGDKDDLLRVSEETYNYLETNNIAHQYIGLPGGYDFEVWKQNIYNFCQLLFK